MPFNKDITGYKNENEFVNYLNGKTVGEVNPIFRDLFDVIFKGLKETDRIVAWNNLGKQKADMFIRIREQEKGVSIKKGVKNSVHVEHIDDFCDFLKKNYLSKKDINSLLRYHYADGTINGTGKNRVSASEYKVKNQGKIDEINKLFMDKRFVKKVVNRFVLIGNNATMPVDCIIYGVLEDFLWITKEEVMKIMMSRMKEYSTGLHISHLTIQPMNRCLNRNTLYESKRHYIQAKWYNISDDIIEIMCQR